METDSKRKSGYKHTPPGWIPEEWEVMNLGRIVNLKGRIGWRGYRKEDLRSSGPLVIGGTQISKNHLLDLSDPVYLSREKFEESPEIQIQVGDIVLVKTGNTIGKCAIIRANIGEACINPNTVILRDIKSDGEFVYQWMTSSSFQRQIWSWVAVGAQPSVNQENLRNIQIPLPPLPEQRQIARILSTWDRAIKTMQQLIDKKQQRKNGLMQQLLTSKKRLPGFRGEWKEAPLKELVDIRGRVGWKGYTKDDLRDDGPLTLGAKHINEFNKLDLTDPTYLSREKFEESPEIMVCRGDILLVQRGSLGKVVLIDRDIGDATINPSMVILRASGLMNERYLYYQFTGGHLQRIISSETSSTGVPMISQKQIGTFPVLLPTEKEQQHIAAVLTTADKEIGNLKQQLAKLQEQKKGLMQVLLTGRVRTQ